MSGYYGHNPRIVKQYPSVAVVPLEYLKQLIDLETDADEVLTRVKDSKMYIEKNHALLIRVHTSEKRARGLSWNRDETKTKLRKVQHTLQGVRRNHLGIQSLLHSAANKITTGVERPINDVITNN